jgi:hypothetical protein
MLHGQQLDRVKQPDRKFMLASSFIKMKWQLAYYKVINIFKMNAFIIKQNFVGIFYFKALV